MYNHVCTVYCTVAVYFGSSTGYTVTVCTSTIRVHTMDVWTFSQNRALNLNLHILHSLCPRTIFSARFFVFSFLLFLLFLFFSPFIPFCNFHFSIFNFQFFIQVQVLFSIQYIVAPQTRRDTHTIGAVEPLCTCTHSDTLSQSLNSVKF